MAHVTNVMLSIVWGDEESAATFIRRLEQECPHKNPGNRFTGCGSLNPVSGQDANWGGYKLPECQLYAGTLNGADLAAVVAQFGKICWRFPRNVQLFIMDQDQSHFRVWMLDDASPHQYAPTKDLTWRDRFPE